jgi:integral membrane protein (TIGR01906 family)
MRKALTSTFSILASIALFATLFFTSIEWVAFNENRYASEQEKYRVAETMGVSKADLKKIMHELLLYCRGERADLNMQASVGGQMREIFDEREKAHMVDVQRLFVRGFKLRTILIASFLFLVLLLIYTARKRTLRELARGWVATASALGALLMALGVYFAVDFDKAWTQFHLVFFSNDLWQLYENEALIQMLMPLFDGIVRAAVVTAVAALAVVTVLAVLILRRKPKSLPEADGDGF